MSPPPPNPPQEIPDFLLVLPSYREAGRLPQYLASLVETLASAPFRTDILVVDDGSPAEDQRELRAAFSPIQSGNCRVLPALLLTKNGKKGDAILQGWSSLPAKWKAFADADGSTDAAEVRRVLGEIRDRDPAQTASYFAVRSRSGPLRVRRTRSKLILSRLFSILAGLALRAPAIDFQCGFKVIPGSALPKVERYIAGRGFCFDPALFLALRSVGIAVETVPIAWSDQPGGKVSAWRNGPGMLAGLAILATCGPGPRR